MISDDFGGSSSKSTGTRDVEPEVAPVVEAVMKIVKQELANTEIAPVSLETVDTPAVSAPATQPETQTEPQAPTVSRWKQAREQFKNNGIAPVAADTTDDFLRGFNEDYEDEPVKTPQTSSRYTGNWEPVQADTAGSGFQIRARTDTPKPQTYEEIQAAYEKAKTDYDAVYNEMERYARESNDPYFMNTPWYEALNREQERAFNQYKDLEEEYTALQSELERQAKQTSQEAMWEEYFKAAMLPDSPAANYVYYYGD